MGPKIVNKEAFLVAGIAGRGDDTLHVWETYEALSQRKPIENKAETTGYEVRVYPGGEGPGTVHVGVVVKDNTVPPDYALLSLPAATYVEFEIYPAKGYDSSNQEMDRWLKNNAANWKQALLEGHQYCIEVYDERFRGNDDPESIVGMLVPIAPAGENPLVRMAEAQLGELGRQIEACAGPGARERVMQGCETAPYQEKTASWLKGAIDRLDEVAGPGTGKLIMTACGRHCHNMNRAQTDEAIKRRNSYATEEEFLKNEIHPPPGVGSRYEREGDIIRNYYTPRSYGAGMRCYCYLMGALPESINASPTFCRCALGFIEQYWQSVLGRPVRVELGKTAITDGTDECEFIIYV